MLTREEKLEIEAQSDEDGTAYCDRSLQIQFEIYNKRYPKFAKSGDEDQRFLAWKRYLAVAPNNSESFCIIYSVFDKIMDTKSDTGLVFCGIFSHAPETSTDNAFFQALEELVSYASVGSLDAMDDFLGHHRPGSSISLNSDVELYIRKFLQKNDAFRKYEGSWYTAHLEPLLTPERIEFVNAAVERGDFEAVLDTTAPCPTP